MGKDLYRAEQFIKAIPGSGGIISTIAERVNCKWHTAAKYIREKPTVAKAYDDECERVTDAAESVVINKITKQKDGAYAKWWLTKKGKDRGFVERKEHEVKVGDLRGMSDDELLAIIEN